MSEKILGVIIFCSVFALAFAGAAVWFMEKKAEESRDEAFPFSYSFLAGCFTFSFVYISDRLLFSQWPKMTAVLNAAVLTALFIVPAIKKKLRHRRPKAEKKPKVWINTSVVKNLLKSGAEAMLPRRSAKIVPVKYAVKHSAAPALPEKNVHPHAVKNIFKRGIEAVSAGKDLKKIVLGPQSKRGASAAQPQKTAEEISLERMLERDPLNAFCFERLSEIYEERGEYAAALEAAQKAFKLDSSMKNKWRIEDLKEKTG